MPTITPADGGAALAQAAINSGALPAETLPNDQDTNRQQRSINSTADAQKAARAKATDRMNYQPSDYTSQVHGLDALPHIANPD